jgi:hypothetical protein
VLMVKPDYTWGAIWVVLRVDASLHELTGKLTVGLTGSMLFLVLSSDHVRSSL